MNYLRLSLLRAALSNLGFLKEAIKIPTGEMSDEDLEAAEEEFGKDPISDEEYAKKIAPGAIEFEDKVLVELHKLLKQKGITTISTGNEGKLGQGSWGTVYAGIYKGKNVAIKSLITGDMYGDKEWGLYQQDAKNWKNIEKLRASMPEEVKKHIPEVFLIEDGIIKITFSLGIPSEFKYQIIVLELLSKLPKDIAKIMDGYHIAKKSVRDIDLSEMLDEVNDSLISAKLSPISSSIFDKIVLGDISADRRNSPITTAYQIMQGIRFWFLYKIKDEDEIDRFHQIFPDEWILAIISEKLTDNDLGETFPYDSEHRRAKKYNPAAEIESLFNALKWLKKHGILWNDVRGENVMMGSDNHIKICDIGGFKLSKKLSANQ